MNCNQKEGFNDAFYFDKANITNVSNKIESGNKKEGEIFLTNKITNLLNNFKKLNFCYSKDEDDKIIIGSKGGTCLPPLMDIDKITNYNNKIRSELDTINFNSEYNNIVGEAIKKRLNEIKKPEKNNENNENTNIVSNKSKCLTITNDNKLEFHFCNLLDNQRWIEINKDGTLYKNPFTSKTLQLQETTTNNNYKISNIDNKYDITITKYSIVLQDICYNNKGKQRENSNCETNKLEYYYKPNTAEYTKKFNEAVFDSAFHIDEYNVAMLPKKFFYFTLKE